MDKAKFYKVKSFSQKGVEHTVRQMSDGEWKCSCPQGVFKGKCDHIRKVRHQKFKHH